MGTLAVLTVPHQAERGGRRRGNFDKSFVQRHLKALFGAGFEKLASMGGNKLTSVSPYL